MGALLVAAELYALSADMHRASKEARKAAAAQTRCNILRRSLDRVVSPAFSRLSGDESLTAREREVAELAARGRTNADIAEELFLSVRTVENHLQRCYRKLGIAGRDDLPDALGL